MVPGVRGGAFNLLISNYLPKGYRKFLYHVLRSLCVFGLHRQTVCQYKSSICINEREVYLIK